MQFIYIKFYGENCPVLWWKRVGESPDHNASVGNECRKGIIVDILSFLITGNVVYQFTIIYTDCSHISQLK